MTLFINITQMIYFHIEICFACCHLSRTRQHERLWVINWLLVFKKHLLKEKKIHRWQDLMCNEVSLKCLAGTSIGGCASGPLSGSCGGMLYLLRQCDELTGVGLGEAVLMKSWQETFNISGACAAKMSVVGLNQSEFPPGLNSVVPNRRSPVPCPPRTCLFVLLFESPTCQGPCLLFLGPLSVWSLGWVTSSQSGLRTKHWVALICHSHSVSAPPCWLGGEQWLLFIPAQWPSSC